MSESAIIFQSFALTVYENGHIVANSGLYHIVDDAKEQDIPFWEALNNHIADEQWFNCPYFETTGWADPYILGLTNAPAFFIDNEDNTDWEKALYYPDYQIYSWQDVLLDKGEVWFKVVEADKE